MWYMVLETYYAVLEDWPFIEFQLLFHVSLSFPFDSLLYSNFHFSGTPISLGSLQYPC